MNHLNRVFLLLMLTMTAFAANATSSVLVLGDSLSAAYRIDEEQGWVALLQQKISDENYPADVINASISGETSAGGLARLPKLLQTYQPQLVVLELGGNDGLRGYPISKLKANLSKMIELSRQSGAHVLLLGMRIPPNYGARYSGLFADTYAAVAEQYQIPWVPFFLDGVATQPALMKSDGIHPTAEAQLLLLDNVWPSLAPLLNQLQVSNQ